MNYINTYIPLKLNIDDLRISNIQKQNLALLIHQLILARRFAPDDVVKSSYYSKGWIQLNKQKLVKISKGIYEIRVFAIQEGILECDDSYQAGASSKKYRLNPNLLKYDNEVLLFNDEQCGRFRMYKVTKEATIKAFAKRKKEQYEKVKTYPLLKASLKKLRIKKEQATKQVQYWYDSNEIKIEQAEHYHMSIRAIDEKDTYISVDDFSGRMHTNFSSLKKELRDFVYFEGEENATYTMLDINNSQPFILSQLFKKQTQHKYSDLLAPYTHLLESKEDIKTFQKYADAGTLWNYCSDKTKIDKDKIKKGFIVLLFSKSDSYLSNASKALIELFPTLFRVLNEMKQIKNHIEIARILQKIEVDFILNISYSALEENGMTMFLTIHDSIFINKKYEQEALKVIEHAFIHNNLTPPSFKNDFSGITFNTTTLIDNTQYEPDASSIDINIVYQEQSYDELEYSFNNTVDLEEEFFY